MMNPLESKVLVFGSNLLPTTNWTIKGQKVEAVKEHRLHGHPQQGFSFLPKGGQVHICVQSMWQNRGVRGHAPLGNFDFGLFIRRNLVESGTVFAQTYFTIYCVINTFIKA